MARTQSKTLAPLLILRILETYSDEQHPITREEIERILDEKYGITMERKAFFRHIDHLNELDDVDICRVTVKLKGEKKRTCAGFYLIERSFTEIELRVIIDALSGSQYLSQKETKELVQRLAGLSSRHFQKKMEAYQFIGFSSKSANENLLLNLQTIDEAICEHKQICFDRRRTSSSGKKEPSDCRDILCTPIRYFVRQHEYYLIGIQAKHETLQLVSYPLSSIANVRKHPAPAQDIRSIPEYKYGIDWQTFYRKHPVMSWLQGKPELCTFLCFRWQIDDIKRRFGDELRIRQISEEEYAAASKAIAAKFEKEELVEVSVITDPYAAADFSRSYRLGMWLISPKDARGAVRFNLQSQLEHWERLEQHYIKKENRLNTKVTVRTIPRTDNDIQ